MTTIEQAVCTGVRKLRACTQGFPTIATPYPTMGDTGGLHGIAYLRGFMVAGEGKKQICRLKKEIRRDSPISDWLSNLKILECISNQE